MEKSKYILVKNGLLVNASGKSYSDILIADGKIKQVKPSISCNDPECLSIDASGYYIFPGGIDPHVHMQLPGSTGFSSDDFLSGSKAALFGGTTSIIDFVTPSKGENLSEAIKKRKKEAEKSIIDYSFHVSPVEWHKDMAEEIRYCVEKEGLRSFKAYMAYKDTIGLNDDELLNVMNVISKVKGILAVHCELGDEIEILRYQFAKNNQIIPIYHALSRPSELEAKAVKKLIDLVEKTGCNVYIVHVSTRESLLHIEKAQQKGLPVFAESCPQYLFLDETKYEADFKEAARYVMSPPLRKRHNLNSLWEAISNGVIQSIGTDHCPFTDEQKGSGKYDFRMIPNGAGGVEHRLALLYTYGVLQKKISLEQFVALTSTNPAKIFGLFPKKGCIQEGSDADIIIWDPQAQKVISSETHMQNCNFNIYEGFKTTGTPLIVIAGGKIVMYKNTFIEENTMASFLKTSSA